MKVAYNNCFGGFSLSHAAVMRYAEIKRTPIYAFVPVRDKDGHLKLNQTRPYDPATDADAFMIHYATTPEFSNDSYFSDRDIERDDPALIQVIEELGGKANGSCASLAIEDVPAGSLYRIDEYDGNESVRTQSDYDWKISR